MIGIIDCRSQSPEDNWAGNSPEMLEFFDRPLLQHAVEQMVGSGVTHCVLLTTDTSAVMKRWGTGERWGCTFSAILPSAVTSFLAGLLSSPTDKRVMVGRGDCIPCIPGTAVSVSDAPAQLIFSEAVEDGVRTRIFTGWAITHPRKLLEQCFATQGADGLLGIPRSEAIQVRLCIRSHSPSVFLRSQKLVLDAFQNSVIVYGMELQPGVWATRNATLHPSVKVTGKVYLGENVRVGRDAVLNGPLVLCRDSIVDANAIIENASVQPNTYVGRDMVLQQDIALPKSIIRARQGISVPSDGPHQLAPTDVSLLTHLRELVKANAATAMPKAR